MAENVCSSNSHLFDYPKQIDNPYFRSYSQQNAIQLIEKRYEPAITKRRSRCWSVCWARNTV